MTKPIKATPGRRTASLKIDPDLYNKAVEKCHRESIRLKERITFSSKVEELVSYWVGRGKL